MSYDWEIRSVAKDTLCPHCGGVTGHEPKATLAYWNPTYNYGPMFRAATETEHGIHDFDGKTVAEVLPIVEAMLARMKASPSKFRALEASNRWGTYDEWIHFFEREVVPAFRSAPPDAIVRVR